MQEQPLPWKMVRLLKREMWKIRSMKLSSVNLTIHCARKIVITLFAKEHEVALPVSLATYLQR